MRKPWLAPQRGSSLIICFYLSFVLFFGLCKITVVQVSSGQRDADRQACKEDSQALVFATKIFLVLQLAVLPGMWLWLQKNPALSARAAFISLQGGGGGWFGHRRTAEGAFQDGVAKVASSFKEPRMYTQLTDPPVSAAR